MKRLLLKLTTENTFTLNSNFYKQIDGCTMGGPLSVIFSDIYMTKTEEEVVKLTNPSFILLHILLHMANLLNISTALINHLKQLNKNCKFPLLHETLNNIFVEQLNDESFTKWFSCKLQIRHSKFNEYHSKWRKSLFSEIHGRQELSQNVKQNIYNTQIKNSINSTDGRNGRNLVKLSKRKYIEQYGTIKNNVVVIE